MTKTRAGLRTPAGVVAECLCTGSRLRAGSGWG
jgi:hypothetical protein